MDYSLPFDRIMVDSRTATRGRAGAFELSLPHTMTLPDDVCVMVLDLSCSHTWFTIEGHSSVGAVNHFLYVLEKIG